MQTYRGVAAQLRAFLTTALDGGKWLVSRPAALPRGRNPGIHWTGGCVDPYSRSGRSYADKHPVLPRIEYRSSSPWPSHVQDSQIVTDINCPRW
jgi:hypothetical protein